MLSVRINASGSKPVQSFLSVLSPTNYVFKKAGRTSQTLKDLDERYIDKVDAQGTAGDLTLNRDKYIETRVRIKLYILLRPGVQKLPFAN